MTEKDTAYLGCKIVEHYLQHGCPAIVIPAGFLGEYYIAFNPGADKSEGAWEYGCFQLESDDPTNPKAAFDLYEASLALEHEFHVCLLQDHGDALVLYQKMINRLNAFALPACFRVRDDAFSGSPTLVMEDRSNNNGDHFYLAITDKMQIEVGWYAKGQDDAEWFDDFESAEEFLIERHAIKIDPVSKFNVQNFKDILAMMREKKVV